MSAGSTGWFHVKRRGVDHTASAPRVSGERDARDRVGPPQQAVRWDATPTSASSRKRCLLGHSAYDHYRSAFPDLAALQPGSNSAAARGFTNVAEKPYAPASHHGQISCQTSPSRAAWPAADLRPSQHLARSSAARPGQAGGQLRHLVPPTRQVYIGNGHRGQERARGAPPHYAARGTEPAGRGIARSRTTCHV